MAAEATASDYAGGYAAIAKAGAQVYAAYQSNVQAKLAAADMEIQGRMIMQEAERDANIIRQEGFKFAAEQSLQYKGSGVELMGSALITIAQTKKYAESEARATENKGRMGMISQSNKASVARNIGRAKMTAGMFQAGETAMKGYDKFKASQGE